MKNNNLNVLLNKEWIISRLQILPEEIEKAEEEVIKATINLEKAEEELSEKESELILNGEINGKNETERKSQLTMKTKAERNKVEEAKHGLMKARLKYNRKVNEYRSVRAIASLISSIEDEEEKAV
ncbi:MAG: hypothetical protein ACPLRZ_11605 [Thermovenabulum sp.]|uniref:hypothetical protein n=1 Tax=Thermovenabulum sp. TaxID=3100335 RepID=UPI003C7E74F0